MARSDDEFKETVRFWDDPAIERVDVNLTCERCELSRKLCSERVAEPTVHAETQRRREQEAALEQMGRQVLARRGS